MKNFPEYMPTRSLIYVNCAREEYRHKLQHWLYSTHIPDSISQFEPYCNKYAFYNALPVPPEGERFGTNNLQLTEHYWMVSPSFVLQQTKTLEEIFPLDVLRWQGNIPDIDPKELMAMNAHESRAVSGGEGANPFVFVFIPVWWDEDLKGKGRTIADGPNYRWQFILKYPEGVSAEDGEKWFYDVIVPYFQNCPLCNRILTSKVLKELNGTPYDRVAELWFDGPDEWYEAVVKNADQIAAPAWRDKCSQDKFPYVKPMFEMTGIFLSDYAASDILKQYRGYIQMR